MIEEIEPGSCKGDMFAFYESFFEGKLLVDLKEGEADLSKVIPIHSDNGHLDFLKLHLKSLGFKIRGEI